jgi:hypothetical protein
MLLNALRSLLCLNCPFSFLSVKKAAKRCFKTGNIRADTDRAFADVHIKKAEAGRQGIRKPYSHIPLDKEGIACA